jgi:hypothetical protein
MAQKTKELSVLQTYLLLMDAYFSVLDDRTPLNLFDPGLVQTLSDFGSNNENRNPLDRLEPTGVKPANELDPRTNRVRKMLRQAMFDHFYKRYHPTRAYRGRVPRVAHKKDYIFSYLMDMQSMFHPALANGRLLQRIIHSFDDATREEKEKHYSTLKCFIWNTVMGLAERVAFQIINVAEKENAQSTNEAIAVPKAKKQRVMDPSLALLETLVSTQATRPIATTERMPNQMAQQELDYYLNIPPEQWPRFEDTLNWWNSRIVADNMPCLSQVAKAILSCTPSSGGLECDFGLLKDVVKSKRASLSQGFVEVEMMLKLNKHLFISCPEKVIKLPNDKWEDYIPKRPQAEEADGDDEGDEEGTAPNEEIEEEGATINCVSNTQSNRESEDTDSDTNSLEEFGLDEYGDIVQETQLPLTDSQLSTVTVFDPEETQIPGKLY